MFDFHTKLFTSRKGKQVGEDQFGNLYYVEKSPREGKKSKRWVVYKGEIEASKVPPEWHMWLHYTTDELPSERPHEPKAWEKPHLPNLTMTDLAYRPPGHSLKGGQRDAATGDYEAWKPE